MNPFVLNHPIVDSYFRYQSYLIHLNGHWDYGNPVEVGTLGISAGMEADVAGFPRGWTQHCCGTPAGMEKILQDSRGNAAVLDFLAHLYHATRESGIHFFHVQNFWCMLNYNDNAN